MVFDIDGFTCEEKEWNVGKRKSSGLLPEDGIGRGGKRKGRGRKEREKKGREAAALTIKNRSRAPDHAVSINFAARLKCYRRHGP